MFQINAVDILDSGSVMIFDLAIENDAWLKQHVVSKPGDEA